MHTERLLTLASFLDSVPWEQFDLESWFGENHCGSTACAIGWATRIPEFQEQGFSAKWNEPRYCMNGVAFSFGWHAVWDFFQLSELEAEHLFWDSSCLGGIRIDQTPSEVAGRIRDFVANGIPKEKDNEQEASITGAGSGEGPEVPGRRSMVEAGPVVA